MAKHSKTQIARMSHARASHHGYTSEEIFRAEKEPSGMNRRVAEKMEVAKKSKMAAKEKIFNN